MPRSFEDALAELLDNYQNVDIAELISAMELQIMALREQAASESTARPNG